MKYFKLYELLPRELYVDEVSGWDKFDPKLLETLDVIREILGVSLICNNWKHGGSRNYCGARIPKCKEYSYGSYHTVRSDRKVMAADLISTKMSATDMRAKIIANASKLPHNIRIENGVSWLHVDVAEKKGCKVYLFNA